MISHEQNHIHRTHRRIHEGFQIVLVNSAICRGLIFAMLTRRQRAAGQGAGLGCWTLPATLDACHYFAEAAGENARAIKPGSLNSSCWQVDFLS